MVQDIAGPKLLSFLLQTQSNPDGLTPGQRAQIAIHSLNGPAKAADTFVALLVPIAFFATIIVIFWLSIRQRQARIQARADVQKQLLDKFSLGREFAGVPGERRKPVVPCGLMVSAEYGQETEQ